MWKVVPYRSVGPVEFGMAPEEVSAALGAWPDAVYGEGYVERYGQVFVRYDPQRRCCVVNVGDPTLLFEDDPGVGGSACEWIKAEIMARDGDAIAWDSGIASFGLGLMARCGRQFCERAPHVRVTAFAPGDLVLDMQRARTVLEREAFREQDRRVVEEWLDNGEWELALGDLALMCEAAAPEVPSPDLEMLADLARRAGEDAPACNGEALFKVDGGGVFFADYPHEPRPASKTFDNAAGWFWAASDATGGQESARRGSSQDRAGRSVRIWQVF